MNLNSLRITLYGGDSPRASVVRVNQVLELAKSAPSMAIGNIVNSGFIAILFHGTMPHPLLGGFVAIVWLLSAARLKSWWRHRRRPHPMSMSRKPLVRSTLWSGAAGAIWGAMGFILIQQHEMPFHVLVVFVVGGQAAAAAIWIAPLPAASLGYILPSMAPVVAGLAFQGGSLQLAMAGMLATYTVVLVLFTRKTHQNFVHAVRAGFERERLVVQLETAHAQLEERVRQRTAELSGTNRRLEKEIEERQVVETELRGNQQLLQTIIDAVPLRISMKDSQGNRLLANKALRNFWNLPDGVGMPADNAYPHLSDADNARAHEYERQVLEEGRTIEYERERTLKDGGKEWVQVRWVPLHSPEDKITGLVLVTDDITQRKYAAAEVRESRDQLRLITDNLPAMIAYIDTERRFRFANKSVLEWYNLPKEQIIGSGLDQILSPDTIEKMAPWIEAALTGERVSYEETVAYPDGRRRNVEIKYIPHIGEDGQVRGYVGMVSDIGDRLRVEAELRASERRAVDAQSRLMDAIESIPEGFIMYDSDERFVLCNSMYRDFYPHAAELLVPGSKLEDVARAIFERGAVVQAVGHVEEWMEIRLQEHRLANGSHEQQLSDGRWLLCNTSKTSGGDTVRIRTDISQLKQQEERLHAAERLQQSVFDAIPVPVWFKDTEGRYGMVNNALCELFDLAPEQVLGKSVKNIKVLSGAIISRVESEEKHALETGEAVDLVDQRLDLKDGRIVWQNVIKAPMLDYEGNLAGLVCVGQDTTERVLAEEAATRREEQLRAVIENIPAAVFYKDQEGRYVLVNKVFEQWCALPAEEIVGKMAHDIFEGEIADRFAKLDRRVLENRDIEALEINHAYADGKERMVLTIKFPVFDDEGELIGVGTVGLDQTERRKAEEDLRSSESRYHTLASSVPVGIFRTDAQGHCLYVNERWSEMTGLSAAAAFGDGWVQSAHPEDREEVFRVWNEAVESGAPFVHEYRFLRPDGVVTRVIGQAVAEYGDAGQVIGYVGSITDITDRTRLEEQLRQSQKMEAVGQLAGGVAHDFNNMLQVVISYVHIARSALNNPESLTKYLDNIGKGADRAANLTRQLLTFSRKDVLQPKTVDINDLISNLMKMLARLLGENIEMDILPGNGLKSVNADPGMLEQVLVNLSVNARDAMPEGGRLVLETSDFYADAEFCKIHGWKKPGNYVLISISDTGLGMTEVVREHIFEPFFTTKEAGKGTGLGLSMVYNIIAQHEGNIDVYSEMGVGSTFRIYLPAIVGKLQKQETQDVETVAGGEETILIAEDEASVRELLCELLEGQGYRVLVAHDGEEAVSQYRSREEPIDLVIMDVVMPRVSGRAAYEQIREIDPRVPIVFSTGYAANTLDKEFLAQDGLKIIHKPYTPNVLFQAVREGIDRAAEAADTSPQSA